MVEVAYAFRPSVFMRKFSSRGIDMFKPRYLSKPAGFVRSWLPVCKSVLCAQDLGGTDSDVAIRTKQNRELLLNDRDVKSLHDRVGCYV